MKILYLFLACTFDGLAVVIAYLGGSGLIAGILPAIGIFILLTAAIYFTTKAEMDILD